MLAPGSKMTATAREVDTGPFAGAICSDPIHGVFFHAVARPEGISVSGPPQFSAGHRIAAGEDGVFAEWAWDGRALHARGDRYGAYPLFYSARAGEIALSPSLVTLATRVSADLDYDALAAFLRLGFFLAEDTPFKGIKTLPPQAHVHWSGDGLRLSGQPFWPGRMDCSRDDAIDAFVAASRSAIQRRLAPDGRVALPLSGGRDSRHILCALVEAGAPPDVCVTVRPFPPRAHMEVPIAKAVAGLLRVPHQILEQSRRRVAAESRKNVLTHFCSDEHAHFLPLADYLSTERSTSYDGLAGDMLTGQSGALEPELRQLLADGRLAEAAERLFEGYGKRHIEQALSRLLTPQFYARVSRSRAVARVSLELRRHLDAPNAALSFFFWNRTRRELALAPYAMMADVTVFTPYLDREIYDVLMALPPSVTADHTLHTAAIERAYPRLAHVPFEEGRNAQVSRWYAARTAAEIARALVTRRGHVRRRYVFPRLAAAALTGRPDLFWFLPQTIYLEQLGALTGAAGVLAPE